MDQEDSNLFKLSQRSRKVLLQEDLGHLGIDSKKARNYLLDQTRFAPNKESLTKYCQMSEKWKEFCVNVKDVYLCNYCNIFILCFRR